MNLLKLLLKRGSVARARIYNSRMPLVYMRKSRLVSMGLNKSDYVRTVFMVDEKVKSLPHDKTYRQDLGPRCAV